MGVYKRGDEIKVKFQFKQTEESEWLWLCVTYSDDEKKIVIGCLDSEPKVNTNLRFGMEFVIGYGSIRDHIKASGHHHFHDSP
jgi:uncharacterized protein YegJ (DUF2314 family)